jgi:methylenetetrahydrofolate reductase (NADPH)
MLQYLSRHYGPNQSNLERMTTFSIEFFPPRDPAGHGQLLETVRLLAPIKPKFMTVTFGAGGSTRDGTRHTIADIQRLTDTPIGAHLTFYGTKRDDVLAYADELWAMGVHELVALRGDAPKNGPVVDTSGLEYFQKTPEFVTALKSRHGFMVNVGAYPEKHPASPDRAADLQNLREKMDAGADRAITQFFFDNELYHRFIDDVTAAGIRGTMIPGLLPIHDIVKVRNFAAKCGATIPDAINARFDALTDDRAAQQNIAVEILSLQIDDLIKHGVPHIHLYSLNRADLILAALGATGLLSI